jgi:chromosome segregation ATPase
MGKQQFTIKEVAEKHNLSAKTVQRAISEHPEFGVVMKPRTKTLLTYEQVAKISSVLDKKHIDAKNDVEIAENSQNMPDFETVSNSEISQFSEQNQILRQVEELQRQIVSLTERAAKAEGRVEGLENLISELKEQRNDAQEERKKIQAILDNTNKLLESSEAKAERAQAEAESFKPSIFGFYRKQSIKE